jgi:hypothetical protein
LPSSRSRGGKPYPYLLACQNLKEVKYFSTFASSFVVYPDHSAELTLNNPTQRGQQKKYKFENVKVNDLRELVVSDNDSMKQFKILIRDLQQNRNYPTTQLAFGDFDMEFRKPIKGVTHLSQSLDCVVARSFLPNNGQSNDDDFE